MEMTIFLYIRAMQWSLQWLCAVTSKQHVCRWSTVLHEAVKWINHSHSVIIVLSTIDLEWGWSNWPVLLVISVQNFFLSGYIHVSLLHVKIIHQFVCTWHFPSIFVCVHSMQKLLNINIQKENIEVWDHR